MAMNALRHGGGNAHHRTSRLRLFRIHAVVVAHMTDMRFLLIIATIYVAPHATAPVALSVSGVIGLLAVIMWWKS